MRQPFILVIVDEDRKIFSTLDPMTDDTPWIDAVVRWQEAGRRVRCFTAPNDLDRKSVAVQYARQTGYQHVEQSVLTPPENQADA